MFEAPDTSCAQDPRAREPHPMRVARELSFTPKIAEDSRFLRPVRRFASAHTINPDGGGAMAVPEVGDDLAMCTRPGRMTSRWLETPTANGGGLPRVEFHRHERCLQTRRPRRLPGRRDDARRDSWSRRRARSDPRIRTRGEPSRTEMRGRWSRRAYRRCSSNASSTAFDWPTKSGYLPKS